MRKINIFKLVTSILICEIAGLIGSFFTAPAINTWYAKLLKPGFNPPDWVFAPVWMILFLLMGISLYLVREKRWESDVRADEDKKEAWNPISTKLWRGTWREENAILIFYIQLGLNILWSVIFFGLKSFDIAFIEILMLWFAILYTIVNFYRISKPAGYLLIPYILWVSFASVLNFFIWWLN
ncbi:tryptophan-rich sensory protein [Patescibacteria group bacterium]|nr:tryptophan-rich sensory protein [Patescibacteria group bacterium]MBU1876912.1 tryptophan-rich sensory protein [Patescibacteria group bacterium]